MGHSTYEVFQQAKARIEAKTHDYRDEVIVALWAATAQALTGMKAVQKDLENTKLSLADSVRENDILGSRLAKYTAQQGARATH